MLPEIKAKKMQFHNFENKHCRIQNYHVFSDIYDTQ